MQTVRAKAPTRIDLAGGTLDLWPIHHLLKRKATVNVGVTLYAKADVSPSPDGLFHLISLDQEVAVKGDFASVVGNHELPLLGLLLGALWPPQGQPLVITTNAMSPAGAGLGGSSCLGVAVAAGLLHQRHLSDHTPKLGEADLIRIVQDAEAKLIHAPTGVQDYWGGMRGNVNILRFPFGRIEVETLPAARLPGLAAELILCYSGKSRASALNNWEIFKRLFDKDRDLLAAFETLGALAEDCAGAVQDGDLRRALHLSQQEWSQRVRMWPTIETVETRRIDLAARAAGAEFTRVCGAGGGGVMAVFAPPAQRKDVQKAMEQVGGRVLDATIATEGLRLEMV